MTNVGENINLPKEVEGKDNCPFQHSDKYAAGFGV